MNPKKAEDQWFDGSWTAEMLVPGFASPRFVIHICLMSPIDRIFATPAQIALSDAIESAAASAVTAALEVVQNGQQTLQPATQAQTDDQAEYLTVSQAASLLGLSIRSVWRRVSAGELPKPHYFGQLARWRRSDLLNLPRHNKPSGRSRPNIPPKPT